MTASDSCPAIALLLCRAGARGPVSSQVRCPHVRTTIQCTAIPADDKIGDIIPKQGPRPELASVLSNKVYTKAVSGRWYRRGQGPDHLDNVQRALVWRLGSLCSYVIGGQILIVSNTHRNCTIHIRITVRASEKFLSGE